MTCANCQRIGEETPATTTRAGEHVCDDCAGDIDRREKEQADLRESAYDERGVRK